MVVNHLEKLFVTNDAATIIKELEVDMICDLCDFVLSLGLCDIMFCYFVLGRLLYCCLAVCVMLFT